MKTTLVVFVDSSVDEDLKIFANEDLFFPVSASVPLSCFLGDGMKSVMTIGTMEPSVCCF